ncbi:hypothetical protein D9M69_500180 [compost metagenome]
MAANWRATTPRSRHLLIDQLPLWLATGTRAGNAAGCNLANAAAASDNPASTQKPPCQLVKGSTHQASALTRVACDRVCTTMKIPVIRPGTFERTIIDVVAHTKTPSPKPAKPRSTISSKSSWPNVVSALKAAVSNATVTMTCLNRCKGK